MEAYIWQLGIDWNAVETEVTTPDAPPESYLRGCLSLDGVPLSGTQKANPDDTITFKIFDVTSSGTGRVGSITSLKIVSTAAVKGQAETAGLGLTPSQTTDPLEITQIPQDQSPETTSAFGPAYASWTAPTVYVTAAEGRRFLLTVKVEATEANNNNNKRLFILDPEMVVGPNL